jgi:hypothetical protein
LRCCRWIISDDATKHFDNGDAQNSIAHKASISARDWCGVCSVRRAAFATVEANQSTHVNFTIVFRAADSNAKIGVLRRLTLAHRIQPTV